jgi:hypothetical protein
MTSAPARHHFVARDLARRSCLRSLRATPASDIDLTLVFAATSRRPIDPDAVRLVNPRVPQQPPVLPAVLGEIASDASRAWPPPAPRWLGNLWRPEPA